MAKALTRWAVPHFANALKNLDQARRTLTGALGEARSHRSLRKPPWRLM